MNDFFNKKIILLKIFIAIFFEISLFSILIHIAWRLECINAAQYKFSALNNTPEAFLFEHGFILVFSFATVILTIILMLNCIKQENDKHI